MKRIYTASSTSFLTGVASMKPPLTFTNKERIQFSIQPFYTGLDHRKELAQKFILMQEMNMGETTVCENCRFWKETGGTDEGLVGECRRNSPSPKTLDGALDTKIRFAAWPATGQNQWCGDFEERPMETREILERMAAIEKLEAARKAKKAC